MIISDIALCYDRHTFLPVYCDLSSLTQVSISCSLRLSIIHCLFLPTLHLYLDQAAGRHHFPNLSAVPRSLTHTRHTHRH